MVMASEPGRTVPPPIPRKRQRVASWWVRVSEICLLGYLVGFSALRDDGTAAVWILALSAGIGMGSAIRGIRAKASDARACLVLHALATAGLVVLGVCMCSWPMFVYHWRRFFGL
jgi:hypothetical protein